MSDAVDRRDQKRREIVRLAADLDFGRRYYDYCEAHADRRGYLRNANIPSVIYH